MSPKGAILLHSPGRKPWVNYIVTHLLSLVGAALPAQVLGGCGGVAP